MSKVDLTALKRYVAELEVLLEKAEKLKSHDHIECNVEVNKAMGMASGISQESILLVSDIAKAFSPTATSKPSSLDILDSYFGKKVTKN